MTGRSLRSLVESPASASLRRRSGWRVALSLARAEGRRLVRHPLLWAGVLLGGLLLGAILGPHAFVLPRESVILQVAALPVAAGTLLAAHLATTRPRRDDADPLLVAAPATSAQRTAGLLLAVVGPLAVAVLLVAATLAGMAAAGGVGPVDLVEAATAPALVALAGVVGVLLGRVAPWLAAPWLALVVLAAVQFGLSMRQGEHLPLTAVLAPAFLPGHLPFDPGAVVRPAAAHLVYLAGLVAAFTGGALAVTRPRRTGIAVAVVGVTIAGVGGWAQYRPPSQATVDAVAARVTDPAASGTCVDRPPATRICAVDPYTGWIDRWTGPVAGVRTRLAAAGVPVDALDVIQRPERLEAADSLARWLGHPNPASAAPTRDLAEEATHEAYDEDDPGEIALATIWPRDDDRAQLVLALETARRAVGLPATVETDVPLPPGAAETSEEPDSRTSTIQARCNAVGQAREVVAVWLAAQATLTTADALRDVVAGTGDQGTGVVDLNGSQDNLFATGVAGVRADWSRAATNHALALLERPADEVMDALAADWSRWIDPDTPVRDLVTALDLDPLPTAEQLWERTGVTGEAPEEVRLAFRDTPLPPPDELPRDPGPSSELPVPPPSPFLACP